MLSGVIHSRLFKKVLWCSWVKAATDRSHIKEQLNITRTGALLRAFSVPLCWAAIWDQETAADASSRSVRHIRCLARSGGERPTPQQQSNNIMSAEGKPRKRSQTSPSSSHRPSPDCSILQFNLCGLNMGDWCLVGHTKAGRKQNKTYQRSVSFWSRWWGLGRMSQHTSPWWEEAEEMRVEGRRASHHHHQRCHHQPSPGAEAQKQCPAGCTQVLKAVLQWPLEAEGIPLGLRKSLDMAGTKHTRAA